MTAANHIPIVEVTRGRIVESAHYGSVCMAQPNGSILFSAGDMQTPIFLRSSTKPFQTLAFLERGGAEFYGLDARDIALICASHSGTEAHITALRALQAKVGIEEHQLQCGAHLPYWQKSSNDLLRKGINPGNNHNNCSGKHSGMLAFAKMLGAPLDSYLENTHPVQQAILNTFAEMCQLPPENIELGTDGCTAPVFAVPLPNAASAYARLCQPDGLQEARAKACGLICAAMTAFPDMVAGPERFDTDGMVVGKGAFISKAGAEGYRALSILPGKAKNAASALGITLKISDGDLTLRAGALVVMAILKTLKILDEPQAMQLKAYDRRTVNNWRGREVGEIRLTPEFTQALAALN